MQTMTAAPTARTKDELTEVVRDHLEEANDCRTCEATGVVYEDDDCIDCDASGYVDDFDDPDGPQVECDMCFGHGYVNDDYTCDSCSGTGQTGDADYVIDALDRILGLLAELSARGFQVQAADNCCVGCMFSAASEGAPIVGFHAQAIEEDRVRTGAINLCHDLNHGPLGFDGNLMILIDAADRHGVAITWDGKQSSAMTATL